MKAYRNRKSGFTLVEILIVVIILGILAAIVIPQFTSASEDARKSSTTSLLQTVRSQVELYKLQHGDALPDLTSNWDALLKTSTYGTPSQTFGPYLQTEPRNPMNGSSTVANDPGTDATKVQGTAGFIYDYGTAGAGTGKVYATGKDYKLYVE